jgi:Protein of unknown function (DUF2917)
VSFLDTFQVKKEHVMNIDFRQGSIALHHGQLMHVRGALGTRLRALAGCVWVTQPHHREDLVLKGGESVTLDSDSAIVSALEESNVEVRAPLPALALDRLSDGAPTRWANYSRAYVGWAERSAAMLAKYPWVR